MQASRPGYRRGGRTARSDPADPRAASRRGRGRPRSRMSPSPNLKRQCPPPPRAENRGGASRPFFCRRPTTEDWRLKMAEITAALVKTLREQTGAGMMDCKKALTETGGDLEGAVDWLRKKGLSQAAREIGPHRRRGAGGRRLGCAEGCAMVEGQRRDGFRRPQRDLPEFRRHLGRPRADRGRGYRGAEGEPVSRQ